MDFHSVKLIQFYSGVEKSDALSIAGSVRVIRKKISGRKSGVGMECLGLEQQTSGKCVITIVTACLE